MVEESKSWVDIYAPKTWDEYIGHREAVESIRKKIEKDSLDILILEGPEGSGKTSLARLIAKEIYGDEDEARRRMIDINASDDTGVEVVRTQIKNNVRGRKIDGKKTIVFLDEADYMSSNAQAALRRVTEDNKENAIFIFAVNNISKIIKPIQSRAHKQVYHIGHLNMDESRALVQRFKGLIELDLTEELENEIIAKSGGDARAIVSLLQDWHEGAYVEGDLSRLAKVRQFAITIVDGSEDDPKVLLPLITDRDLTEVMNQFIELIDDWDTKAKVTEIIADTDARVQQSHNVDLHLSHMIYKLVDVWWEM